MAKKKYCTYRPRYTQSSTAHEAIELYSADYQLSEKGKELLGIFRKNCNR